MRWFFAILALALAAPVQAQQNDAEKLYRIFEKKLATAKAYKVTFDFSVTEKNKSIQFKGDLTVADGNKLRTSFTGNDGVKSHTVAIVADGKQMAVTLAADGKSETKNAPIPDKMNENLSGYLTRVGLFFGVKVATNPTKAGASPAKVKMSSFRMIGKEKVTGRDTLIINFMLEVPEEKGKPLCKLWLDTATQLPLKRTFEIADPAAMVRVTELYANWEIDPQLDPKLFLLAK